MANGVTPLLATAAKLDRSVQQFWSVVARRLVSVHHLPVRQARGAVMIYKKRVGDVALNRGAFETAASISSALKAGKISLPKTPRKNSRIANTAN